MKAFNPKENYKIWMPCSDESAVLEPVKILGVVTWLWLNSELHANWRVRLLAVNVLPAIEKRQFSILYQNNIPYAFCSWAQFDDDAEIRYLLNPNSIVNEDWNSGSNIWFIDGLSPFGGIKYLTYFLRSTPLFKDRVGYIRNIKPRNLDVSNIKKVLGKSVGQQTILEENSRFNANLKRLKDQIPT